MKATFWVLLVVALSASVYLTNFADFSGSTSVIARVGSGVVSVGAGIGLWLLRGHRPA